MRIPSVLTDTVCALLVVAGACAQARERVATELLAVQTPVNVRDWMAAHRSATFERYSEQASDLNVVGGTWCGVAREQFAWASAALTERAFFAVPPASELRLPGDDAPHPELTKQCVLGEVLIESPPGAGGLEKTLPQIQQDIARTLGRGRIFRADLSEPYALWNSAAWTQGLDWRSGGSRWVVAWSAKDRMLIGLALTAEAQKAAAIDWRGEIEAQAERALRFAAESGLPSGAVQRMQALISEVDKWQMTGPPREPPNIQTIAPFLVDWVKQSRRLEPEKRAKALYAADNVLVHVPLSTAPPASTDVPASVRVQEEEQETAPLRAKLAAAGADFVDADLAGGYEYNRDWIQEAFRVAPDSEAGQQAFLYLLTQSFHPSCCCAGQEEGFQEVIVRAPPYLREHPHWTIRTKVLLAIGDAYRDIIAVANGAGGDPFDAAKYMPQTKRAYHEALRYYREAMMTGPGSDAANEALRSAWALEVGIAPLTTRFVCIYD